jgi:uncharacterized protein with PIN domain
MANIPGWGGMPTAKTRFIIDQNVGKLAKLLRLLGYDTVFFADGTDAQLVRIALGENRVILTRDTHILERRLVTTGKVKAILIQADNVNEQIKQVVDELGLHNRIRAFTLCLECNQPLLPLAKEQAGDRVPPYVLQTQKEYRECPGCHRIYWKGTHWEAMTRRLEKLVKDPGG